MRTSRTGPTRVTSAGSSDHPNRADAVIANDDCDDADAGIHPGVAEVCNSIDDDCDGAVDAEDSDLSQGCGSNASLPAELLDLTNWKLTLEANQNIELSYAGLRCETPLASWRKSLPGRRYRILQWFARKNPDAGAFRDWLNHQRLCS